MKSAHARVALCLAHSFHADRKEVAFSSTCDTCAFLAQRVSQLENRRKATPGPRLGSEDGPDERTIEELRPDAKRCSKLKFFKAEAIIQMRCRCHSKLKSMTNNFKLQSRWLQESQQ